MARAGPNERNPHDVLFLDDDSAAYRLVSNYVFR